LTDYCFDDRGRDWFDGVLEGHQTVGVGLGEHVHAGGDDLPALREGVKEGGKEGGREGGEVSDDGGRDEFHGVLQGSEGGKERGKEISRSAGLGTFLVQGNKMKSPQIRNITYLDIKTLQILNRRGQTLRAPRVRVLP